MALTSTFPAPQALNGRYNSRPRSMSMQDYAPLTIDRESLSAAYQAAVGPSSTPSSNSRATWSSRDFSPSLQSEDTPRTSSSSTLSHHLKAGDNPHASAQSFENAAGVGAGHSLTPPESSSLHRPLSGDTFGQQRPAGPPVVDNGTPLSPAAAPPNLPPRPEADRKGKLRRNPQRSASRSTSDVNELIPSMTDEREPEGNWGRDRRVLPSVPTNVPQPAVPNWEPDYKPQIPGSLTAPSATNAYAQLSAPPPNLPPRRGNYGDAGPSQAGPSGSGQPLHTLPPPPLHAQTSSSTVPSQSTHMTQSTMGTRTSTLPDGAPDFPPTTEEPDQMSPTSPVRKHRPPAEQNVFLRATDRTSMWSTHFIDPSLRNQTIKIPQQVTNITHVALSGLSAGPKTRYNQTIGAPIDGLAQMAKEWVIKPDARFVAQDGGIEIGVGVVDSGNREWGNDKGRKRARVEVESKHGGIKVEVIEIEPNRQIDLKVETKTGDVLVLLPEDYWGVLHVTSPEHEPIFLPELTPALAPVSRPYGSFYTTFVAPLSLHRVPGKSTSAELRAMSGIERYIPKSAREESEVLDQVMAGYAHHTRGEQSKVVITSGKGRIVVGYRDTGDEEAVKALRLAVGAQGGGRKKKWWQV